MKEYKDKTVKEKCDIFARLMNEYAKELGCKNTSFVTLDGNDYVNKKIVPHLTTTNDLCLIFKEALNNPVLSKVMGTHKKEIVVGSEKYSFTNGDDLINPESKYYNKMVLGGKTGMTCPAGYCLGSFAKIRNKYFIVIACYAYVNENKYIDSNKIYNFLYNLTEKTPKGVRE